MYQEVIEKLEAFIREKNHDVAHWLRAGYWVRQIYPKATEIMYIAAICHDVERVFPLEAGEVQPEDPNWDGQEYARWHGGRSAKYLEQLLREFGFENEAEIKRMKELVASHELGGDDEQNVIKDADSISFFENNVDNFLGRFLASNTKENLQKKFDFMFNRISSQTAREIATPMYEKALKKLEVA